MNVQQFQIFSKKFQFNKFFTKAVKKVLVDAFGDKAHFNFEQHKTYSYHLVKVATRCLGFDHSLSK